MDQVKSMKSFTLNQLNHLAINRPLLLCSLCCKIPFHRLDPYPQSFQKATPLFLTQGVSIIDVSGGRPDTYGRLHYQDLDSLYKSAETCEICSLFKNEVLQFIDRVNHGERPYSLPEKYKVVKPKRYSFQITRQKLRDGQETREGFILWTDDGPNDLCWYVAAFNLAIIEESDPLGQVFKGRAIDVYPNSSKNLGRATQWVKECNNDHEDCCPKKEETTYPKRLLDVGTSEGDLIKLCEMNGNGWYTTLSYSWGHTLQLTTTKARYEAHKKGLLANRFTKTMRDAFVVARKMGIRYIWIDALCIIQDDAEDWQRESVKMATYYGNSYLTITAQGARDNIEGCFLARKPPQYLTFNYECDYKSAKRTGQLSIYPELVEEAIDAAITLIMLKEPVTERGWCFQERVLSRRSLFFAKDEMYFECQENFLGEDGFKIKGRYLSIQQPIQSVGIYAPPNTKIELWDALVEAYSGRQLTNRSDKLTAMSGLATKFAEELKDEYLAGLWKSTLPVDMLWQGNYNAAWNPDPKYYIAPSWSWASVNLTGAVPPLYRGKFFQTFARIYTTDVIKTGLNPYGPVSSGRIKISSPLIPMYPTRDPKEDPNLDEEAVGLFKFIWKGSVLHAGRLDYRIDFETLKSLEIFAFVMGRFDPGKQTGDVIYPSVLVTRVKPNDKGDVDFQRVGVVWVKESGVGKIDRAPALIAPAKTGYPTITIV